MKGGRTARSSSGSDSTQWKRRVLGASTIRTPVRSLPKCLRSRGVSTDSHPSDHSGGSGAPPYLQVGEFTGRVCGGGTTGDVCQIMGRRCFSFDRMIDDGGSYRRFIEPHDLFENGIVSLPDTKSPSLIFVDPPYWNMKQKEYGEGSISELSLEDYYDFMKRFLQKCYDVLDKRGLVAFLIQNQTGKGKGGFKEESLNHIVNIYNIMEKNGFLPIRMISCPVSTQQTHPQQVNKAKDDNRLLGIVRDLIVMRKE